MCGISLGGGSYKRLPIGCVPLGNWVYRLEFRFLAKSLRLALYRCDVFGRLLLGIPSRWVKVAHYQFELKLISESLSVAHLLQPSIESTVRCLLRKLQAKSYREQTIIVNQEFVI
jgi:hypothetical protein